MHRRSLAHNAPDVVLFVLWERVGVLETHAHGVEQLALAGLCVLQMRSRLLLLLLVVGARAARGRRGAVRLHRHARSLQHFRSRDTRDNC